MFGMDIGTLVLIVAGGVIIGSAMMVLGNQDLRVKLFGKGMVRIFIFEETGLMKKYYVKPNKDGEKILKPDKNSDFGYTYNMKDIVHFEKMPTLFYQKDKPQPIKIKEGFNEAPEISSSQFNSAIQNSVIKDLMKAGGENRNELILMGGILVTVVGILFTGYLVYDMSETISTLSETLKTIKSNTQNNQVP